MSNFLVISNFDNDISWVKDYPNDYIIYDRGTIPVGPEYKSIRSTNVGYNIWDIMRYIVDHYEDLPEYITFCKGNTFPRHISRWKFERIMNNKVFTPMFQEDRHLPKLPVCKIENDIWHEINYGKELVDSRLHPTKFFKTYNELLQWLYKSPIIPEYIPFAPGANYVVPRETVLMHSINVYQNLKLFVQHCKLPGEAHLIERLLYTLWTANWETTEQANTFNDG